MSVGAADLVTLMSAFQVVTEYSPTSVSVREVLAEEA